METTSAVRSKIMRSVKRENTKPEIKVRQLLHSLGYRFRLHRKDLPGSPDIALPKYKTVIFVHGCFWHRHAGCKLASTPKSREAFWGAKFNANVERDARNYADLTSMGWNVIVVWQCELRDLAAVTSKLTDAIR